MLYCWGKIKESGAWINITFCVKIGNKSASEMLSLLKMVYGKHAMKKLSVFGSDKQFKEA